jgi:hypothetical protein
MALGSKLRYLIAVLVAASALLALCRPAPATDGCARTAGPNDVVPNPMPSTPWKGGAVGEPPLQACEEISDTETPSGEVVSEPIDIPPNPEPKKDAGDAASQVDAPVVMPTAAPSSTQPSADVATPERTALERDQAARAKAKARKAKLRRAAKKAAKKSATLRAKKRLQRAARR